MSFFELKLRWVIKDTAAIAKVNPFSGYLSNMGMLMWCATIAITLFSAAVVYKKVPTRKFLFFVCAGIFSAFLLFDDLFMFHETLAPNYLGFGEHVVYVVYIILAVAFFGVFFKEIYESNYVSLLVALGFMALSIGCDYVQNIWLWPLGQWEYLLEEGLKWFGLAWWCSYFVQTGYETVNGLLNPVPAR